ncbi:hypothetical protein KAH81_01995 [bacterium]|nr:hypothetical protein [bacterium]
METFSHKQKLLLFIIFLSLFSLYNLASIGFPCDDTWIHMQTARNFARYGVLSFNVELPTYSSTSPLWSLLLGSIGYLTGLDFLWIGRILSWLCGVFAIILLSKLIRKRGDDYAMVIGLALLSGDVYFSYNMAMEMSLFLLLTASLFLVHRAEIERKRLPIASGILMALTALTRPEGIPLILLFVVHRVWRERSLKGLLALLVALLVYSPWIVYAQKTYGTIVPITIIAKSSANWPLSRIIHHRIRLIFMILRGFLIPIVISLGGIFIAYKEKRLGNAFMKRDLEIAWVLGMLAFYFLGLKEWNFSSRYTVTYGPFIAVLGAWSASVILKYLGRCSKRNVILLITIISILLLALQTAAYITRTIRRSKIDSNLDRMVAYVDKNTPDDATIEIGRIGLAGYVTDRKIIDPAGIATREGLEVRSGKISRSEFDVMMHPDYSIRAGEHEIPPQSKLIYVEDSAESAPPVYLYKHNWD